jgi:hypothetical protein
MAAHFRTGLVLLSLGATGCGWSQARVSELGDPEAAEVVLAHWAAPQQRDWKATYDRLHPDLKTIAVPLKRFTDFHCLRLQAKGSSEIL